MNAIVTGATAGIGKVMARELVKKGMRVRIVGRNPEKTARVAKEIGAEGLVCDLSSMRDVYRLAREVGPVDVLINNAGAINPTFERTVDGLERTFATNHLAYFIMGTEVKAGRVINVSSDAHRGGRLEWDNLNGEKHYSAWSAYALSKLCNILFTRELARRRPDSLVNAFHPGFVASDFLNKPNLLWRLARPLVNVFALTEDQGAQTGVYLATQPIDVSGKYWFKCEQLRPRRLGEDDLAARRLWDESERILKAFA